MLAVLHSVATQGQASKLFGDVIRGMGQLFKGDIPGGGDSVSNESGEVDGEDMDFDDEDMDFYTDTSFDVET